ncbi:MAG: glycosyltransferase [Cytophagales bacterium]|nr:glycosyltransferase [Cytophagales bacterium]
MPLISVVTVTYNAASVLEATMRSVFEQTFTDYEYLIIDGGSTDGTLEIIGQHASRLAYWISEPDAGLYDAMNKGLQVARGRYVWFMNAGDRIYDRDTMAKMFAAAPSDADVLYGDALFFDPTGRDLGLRSRVTPHALPARLTWQSFRFGMVVCHQSFLMRRSLAPEYDLSHRYSADVDWEIRCLKAAKRTVHTQLVLSRYLTGGFSRKNHRRSLQDRYIVLQKHFGVLPNLLNHAWILLRGVLFVLQKRRRY